MFWSAGAYGSASNVQNILEQDAFTLEDLLEEDDLIQECKSQFPKLIAYLEKEDIVRALVKYVVEQPQKDAENASSSDDEGSQGSDAPSGDLKYPLAACEVLSCQLEGVLGTLAASDDLMALLFSFLDRPSPLEATQAGYFMRSASALLTCKPVPVMDYILAHPGVLRGLLHHIACNSVADLLTQLAVGDSGVSHPRFRDWLAYESGLVQDLLSALREAPLDSRGNVVEALNRIAQSQPSPLASRLAAPDCLAELLSHGIASPQLLLPPVVRVLISLLEPSPPDIYGMVPVAFRQTDPEEALGDPAIAAATLEFLAPRLGDIAAVLDVPGAIPEPTAVAGALPQPWGMLPPPLGLHRAMVGALAAAIVRRGDAAARAAITSSGIVPRLLSLFRAYPLNNLLHNEVLALVRAALGSQDEAFERYLVGDCALLEWLASLPETFEARPLREGAPRRSLRVGYIGHIGQMAAAVAAREGESRVLREACSVSATWQVFMDGRMEEQRQREDVHAWRCGRPGPSSPPESEGAHLGDIKALEVGPGRYGMDDDSSSDSSSDEGEAEAGLSRMQGMQALHIMGDDADDLEEWGVGEDEVRLMGEDEEREMGQRVPEEGTRNEERTSGGWLGGPQELQELSTTQRWGVEGVGGGGGGGESRSPSSMDVWMRLAQEVDEDREGGQGAGGRDAGTDAGAASDQGEVEAFNSFNYWKLDFPPVVKDDL